MADSRSTPLPLGEDTLLQEFTALLQARRADLEAQTQRVTDVLALLGSGEPITTPAAPLPAASQNGRRSANGAQRRAWTPAQRQEASRRMKRAWRARKARKRVSK